MKTEDLPYLDAMHAIQTGVAYELSHGSDDSTTPKHLRVGVNSAMVNDAALAGLLLEKGLFTRDEYAEAVRREAVREVARYEQRYGVTFR